jgi:hypothetical protein
MRFAATAVLLIAIAVPAKADRPVTDPERVKRRKQSRLRAVPAVRWNGMKTTASLRSTT